MQKKKRLSMRKLRENLRLRFECKLSTRQISRSTRVSVGAVNKYLKRFEDAGLPWPLPDDMDDTALINKLAPVPVTCTEQKMVDPDWKEVHKELKSKGMTKQLVWEEYCEVYPHNAYSYPQFCHRYRLWNDKQKRSMRQHHRAGEKLFVDYAGLTVPVVNKATGEAAPAQIFVAVLGASNYTFAEASWTQGSTDFISSQVRSFKFFGGVPEMLVPDNLRSAVSKACRYDPDINRSYLHMAEHFGCSIMPARPYKPRDKAKVEVGVQLVERWILMRLRHHTFFSLSELNWEIRRLLEDLNNRPFRQQKGCRRSLFDELDRPALMPLPRQASSIWNSKSPGSVSTTTSGSAITFTRYHISWSKKRWKSGPAITRYRYCTKASRLPVTYDSMPVEALPRGQNTCQLRIRNSNSGHLVGLRTGHRSLVQMCSNLPNNCWIASNTRSRHIVPVSDC